MDNLVNLLAEPILQFLPRIPVVLLTVAVGIVIIYIIRWSFEKILSLSHAPATLHDILTSVSRVLLWLFLIAAILQSLGLTQIAYVFSGSVAIIGLAIATGATALVQDVISGLFLARDRDFSVGYHIKSAEIEGIIRHIDIRKVRIEDSKGQVHVVPNSNFDRTHWVVINKRPKEKQR